MKCRKPVQRVAVTEPPGQVTEPERSPPGLVHAEHVGVSRQLVRSACRCARQIDLDQLAEGLGGRAPVAPGHHLGLEPGFLALGLSATTPDLTAYPVWLASERIDARIDADLPPVAALVDRHCTPPANEQSTQWLAAPLAEGER